MTFVPVMTSDAGTTAGRTDLKVPPHEVRVTGRMTPRAKSGFEALGWTVVENAP